MARTAVGGDDDRPKKKFTDKIKNSPAAKEYKEKGAKHVAKKLGSMAADVASEAASKASYHLGLTEGPSEAHPASQAIRNRGGDSPRAHHFVSSYSSSRGDVHGECATCHIDSMRG